MCSFLNGKIGRSKKGEEWKKCNDCTLRSYFGDVFERRKKTATRKGSFWW